MAISSSTCKYQAPPPAMRIPRHSPQGDPQLPHSWPCTETGHTSFPRGSASVYTTGHKSKFQLKRPEWFWGGGRGSCNFVCPFPTAPSREVYKNQETSGIKNQETSHKNLFNLESQWQGWTGGSQMPCSAGTAPFKPGLFTHPTHPVNRVLRPFPPWMLTPPDLSGAAHLPQLSRPCKLLF